MICKYCKKDFNEIPDDVEEVQCTCGAYNKIKED